MNGHVSLVLTVDEINGIIKVLGDLPTASNAYPLMVKITQQLDEEIEKLKSQSSANTTENTKV